MSQRRALSSLGIVLAISLIANAALFGLLLGNAVGKGKPPPDRGPRGGGEEAVIARALESVLPDSARREMRSAFRAGFREAAPFMQQKREARQALKEALAANPFNAGAVEAAFEDIRNADQRLTESFHGVLAEELASLTQDQRDELVAWMEEMDAKRREWRAERREGRRHGDPRDEPRERRPGGPENMPLPPQPGDEPRD
ncbi:MAG: periplasmic heavy metal sensor [Pseudomonadota bacterium]|nr:periplasmic heavy metal sensor [Pseudomonadota bacterium]